MNSLTDPHHKSSPHGVQAPPAHHWLLPRRWLAILVIAGLVPWLVLAWLLGPLLRSQAPKALNLAPITQEHPQTTGPWGELTYEPMVIAAPLSNLIELYEPMMVDHWRFANMGPLELDRFLNSTDLPTALVRDLMASAQPAPEIRGTRLSPTHAQVEALTPQARGAIYQYLSRFAQNPSIASATCFPRGSEQAWLAGTSLPQQLLDRIRRMFYTSDRYVWFADLPLLLAQTPDESTRAELAQTLTRQYTYLVKLRIHLGQDVSSLVRYWGRGGREKQIAPLLESLAKLPGTHELGIQNLLPPFARTRLYTFSDPSLDPRANGYDCHWTGFNFFNAQPDPQPTDSARFYQQLQDNYVPVYGDLQFGDLVVYAAPRAAGSGVDFVHTAVHIAADLVFTKNSPRPTRPWMFMRAGDMKDYYAYGRSIEVRYFRRKDMQ